MSTTLTNMGLISWTSGGDFFSSSDLSANWSKVDAHDHTTGKGVQIPTGGLANGAVTGAKIAADAVDATKILDGSVGSAELASNSVTTVKITDANVTPAKLAANPYLLARALMSGAAIFDSGAVSGTIYALPGSGNPTGSAVPRIMRYLDPASSAIAPQSGGLTLRYLLDWNVITNSVAPVATVTAALYPVTAGGGASSVLTPTLGAAVTGSSGTQGSTSANLRANYGTSFAAPAAGYYTIGLNVTGTIPAGALVSVQAALYAFAQ